MVAFLYRHQNRHAPKRSNGKRFWGYPTRNRKVTLIGVHTAENIPDIKGDDLGAENVARYFSTTSRPASAHECVDSDSTVVCLPPGATAFAAVNFNANGWHIELCTKAAKWNTLPPQWKDKLLRRGARRCARIMKKFGIPAKRISKAEAQRGVKGFAAHADLDPARRSDPGKDFPWKTFLAYAAKAAEVPVPVKNATPVLRRGHKGSYVQEAARHLLRHGGLKSRLTNTKTGKPRTRFTLGMEREVKRFQRRKGLDVDGLVGPKTWAALRK